MKRLVGVFATLAVLVGLGFVATPASPAQAAGTQLLEVPNFLAHNIFAYGDDKVGITSCGDQSGGSTTVPNAFYASGGTIVNTLPQSTGSGYNCSIPSGQAAGDGTFYANHFTNNNSTQLIAWKNNRQLWSTDTTSPTACYTGMWGVTDKKQSASSISTGPDGMLYMLLTSGGVCDDRLVRVDPADGTLTTLASFAGASDYIMAAELWTYEDKLVVVDRDGMYREFDYDGTENTSVQYSFPINETTAVEHQIMANAAGTVFVATYGATVGSYNAVKYHKANGDTGSVNTGLGLALITLSGTDNVDVIWHDRIVRIDTSTDTASTLFTTSTPSGYTNGGLQDYVEDTDGNGLMVSVYGKSDGTHRLLVDLVDASTYAITNLYSVDPGVTGGFNPQLMNSDIDQGVADGNLYLSLCILSDSSDCYASTVPSTWIYKIGISGFGDPIKDVFKQNGYASTKLNYVAMGDSFSSGEGNPDFNPWTDRTSVNECHRSQVEAYPVWLANAGGLNLGQPDFVACSGATTDTLLNGGSGSGAWGEPAQVSALSDSTNAVTLTIGGNDVGFSSVLGACVNALGGANGWGCSSDTSLVGDVDDRLAALAGTATGTVYDPNGHVVHSVQSVIEQIATAAPNASIYIAGYPKLFGASSADYMTESSAPGGAMCAATAGATFAYDDTQWMNTATDSLNGVIQDAVDAAQLESIDVTYVSPGGFNGHGLCDSEDPYLHGVEIDNLTPLVIDPGSMHPDEDGQLTAYAVAFDAAMS